jgi:predicted lipid carrier protein YhbT
VFFPRVLTTVGDPAAVLALRNALDNADVDLPADFAALFGPARGIVEWLARHAERQYFHLHQRV